ncbi:pickpocket protein 28-like [Tribolium castaneum]|uniref:pickpocket protein 28-like n=1 Tax=Tribolium castaneum TaxID=7070 RepID=UPI0030FEDE18
MKNNFGKKILTYFREYCDCTSVHGFRYLGEKRTLFEKIWWFIVFTICLSTCIFSIFMVYKKWEQSPVIVSFANRGTPIYKIPFPAVTICPETKTNRNIFNYTQILNKKFHEENLTETENLYFEHMLLICNKFYPASGSNESTYGEEFFDTISTIHPKFNIRQCKNQGQSYNCSQIFTPIFTEEGICFSFNMLDRSEIFRENVIHYKNFHQFNKSSSWSIESGYGSNSGIWTYPQRALLAGAKNGFSIQLISSKSNLDFLCRMGPQGFKVLVHSPASFPTPSQEYFRVPLDQTVIAEVQPTMINTSDSVRAYSKDRRRCYFQTERYLQYFKIYNKVNCEIECLANFTLDMCGCVNFFMPRDNSTSICSSSNLSCMNEAEKILQIKNLKGKLDKKKKKKSVDDCDCLPLCSDLNYNIETSQSDWDWQMVFTAIGMEPFNDTYISSLTIYFKSNDFITSVRNELYGPMDFVANFGGLLGLFTGFSILSLMEIIYFLTVRIFCNKILYRKWAGKDS